MVWLDSGNIIASTRNSGFFLIKKEQISELKTVAEKKELLADIVDQRRKEKADKELKVVLRTAEEQLNNKFRKDLLKGEKIKETFTKEILSSGKNIACNEKQTKFVFRCSNTNFCYMSQNDILSGAKPNFYDLEELLKAEANVELDVIDKIHGDPNPEKILRSVHPFTENKFLLIMSHKVFIFDYDKKEIKALKLEDSLGYVKSGEICGNGKFLVLDVGVSVDSFSINNKQKELANNFGQNYAKVQSFLLVFSLENWESSKENLELVGKTLNNLK